MIPPLRDVALIILLVPMLLCLLIPLALLFATNWLMLKSRRALPSKLQSVHRSMQRVNQGVDKAGEKVASPFIWIETRGEILKTWWRGLRRRRAKQ